MEDSILNVQNGKIDIKDTSGRVVKEHILQVQNGRINVQDLINHISKAKIVKIIVKKEEGKDGSDKDRG
jgi:hypothetical protein